MKGYVPDSVRSDSNIADVAIAVGPRAQELGAQSQVQGEIGGHLPVILRKHCGIALPVGVVVNAAATKAELRRAAHEVGEIGGRRRSVGEEKLPIEHLRKLLV